MSIVKKIPARVVNISSQIAGVYTLEIESLGKLFKYEPGQFLHLALDAYDPSEQWPESRCFSMQSSPDQPNIKITYAVKGKFTSRMEKELHPGSIITLKLPYGDLFTKFHDKGRSVFIAGGTGITPFLSLFSHDSFKNYINPRVYLGFRTKSYNIYENELKLVNICNPKILYEDIDGRLDILDIFSENGTNSYYFISGPLPMIKFFSQTLILKGVSANRILTDDWE